MGSLVPLHRSNNLKDTTLSLSVPVALSANASETVCNLASLPLHPASCAPSNDHCGQDNNQSANTSSISRLTCWSASSMVGRSTGTSSRDAGASVARGLDSVSTVLL
eukprot:4244789-Amphidinium_carterae.1